MKVRDHKKFCCFDYESDTAKHTYELGDVVTKESEDGIEIGVVIQLHEDGDFRTDMFGNASPSEVTLSTIEDIELYRNDLLEDLYRSVYRITYRMEVYIDADSDEDAKQQFQNMDFDELKRRSEFVEMVSLEKEDLVAFLNASKMRLKPTKHLLKSSKTLKLSDWKRLWVKTRKNKDLTN